MKPFRVELHPLVECAIYLIAVCVLFIAAIIGVKWGIAQQGFAGYSAGPKRCASHDILIPLPL